MVFRYCPYCFASVYYRCNILGRSIDAIAHECEVPNNNNQANAMKLRLFAKTGGGILSKNLASLISALMDEKVVIDGDDLVLACVEDDCTQLALSTGT